MNGRTNASFVLVPGACHGGWCFDDLAAALRAESHGVTTPTLTGVAERAHLAHAGVNLDTHITDVLAEFDAHRVTDAVLVGHSYGGMVITAVADRVPDRVRALVYLDAFVPRDGESCWSLTNDEQRQWYIGVDATGYGVPRCPSSMSAQLPILWRPCCNRSASAMSHRGFAGSTSMPSDGRRSRRSPRPTNGSAATRAGRRMPSTGHTTSCGITTLISFAS